MEENAPNIIVGIIDDDDAIWEGYEILFSQNNIELIRGPLEKEKKEILEWIITNNVKCLIIDYKLNNSYAFTGTDLFAYINSNLPEVQCIILTGNKEDSINEELINSCLIFGRDVVTQKDSTFFKMIKEGKEVFEKRIELLLKEYEELLNLKKENKLDNSQEERFVDLYSRLRDYKQIDELPSELLRSKVQLEVEDILNMLKSLNSKLG